MESMEGEMEGPLPICFRTSDDIEKLLPRGKPPFSFLVFPYLDSFNFDRSYSGIYILSFAGIEVLGFQNLSLFSFDFRLLWNSGINRDDITHLQEIYSETQRVRLSTDRCHHPYRSLFYLRDRIFIDGDSESTLSIPLVLLGTHGFIHGMGAHKVI